MISQKEKKRKILIRKLLIQRRLLNVSRVSLEMKMEFVEKVKKMSNEALTKMVQHIQTLAPTTISDLDQQDKIQIKVDDFDRETFAKLNDFVDDIIINE